jgi:phage terminase small subunit
VDKRNNRHELFCREYIIDYIGTQAAIRAGYSKKTAHVQASELLKNPKVLARIRELQKEQTERLAITSDWVVQQLVDVVKKSKEPEPVMKWDADKKQIVESGEYTFDSKGATKALELLGKHLGMYVEKVEEKVDMQIKIEIDYGDEVEDK